MKDFLKNIESFVCYIPFETLPLRLNYKIDLHYANNIYTGKRNAGFTDS